MSKRFIIASPSSTPSTWKTSAAPSNAPSSTKTTTTSSFVLHFPLWDPRTELSRASEVDIFLTRDFVVTVHNGSLKPLVNAFERCQADENERPWPCSAAAPTTPSTASSTSSSTTSSPSSTRSTSASTPSKTKLFESDAKRVIQEIALLRRDIISLRRIIRQQIPVVQQLETCEHPILHERMEEYFGDIVDHLFKLRDIVEENFEVINSFADTADALASLPHQRGHAHPHRHLRHHAAAHPHLQHLRQ